MCACKWQPTVAYKQACSCWGNILSDSQAVLQDVVELMKETMQDRFDEGGDLLCMDIGQAGRQGRGKQVMAATGRAVCCGASTLPIGAISKVFC